MRFQNTVPGVVEANAAFSAERNPPGMSYSLPFRSQAPNPCE
jgi:hypothetical protein